MREQHLVRGAGTVDQVHSAGPGGKRLQQRAQRRHTDATGQQQHPTAPPRRRRERAVRSLRKHAHAGPKPPKAPRVVTGRLDGQPQEAPVRRGRQRERVGLPPAAGREEPPAEELAGLRAQRLQVPARDVHRDDARGLAPDGGDPHAVPQRQPQWPTGAEREQARRDRQVRAAPGHARDPVVGELGADRELMGEGEQHRQVGVQMQVVPGLVRQPAPHGARREPAHPDQQRQGNRGHEHVRFVEHHARGLARHPDVRCHGVPGHDQHRVRHQHGNQVATECPVGGGDPVAADPPLEPGDPAHEHDLDEQQVAAEQPADPTGRGQRLSRAVERSGGCAAPPQPHHRHGSGHQGAEQHGRPPAPGQAAARRPSPPRDAATPRVDAQSRNALRRPATICPWSRARDEMRVIKRRES